MQGSTRRNAGEHARRGTARRAPRGINKCMHGSTTHSRDSLRHFLFPHCDTYSCCCTHIYAYCNIFARPLFNITISMAFNSKPHLPQCGYFSSLYRIPGTDWTITGHSRALERTGFWIPELRVLLDAGVDLPTNAGPSPLAICITHGHIDHCNALPMLLRHTQEDTPTQILAHCKIVHRLRSFAQLSWAVKVDIDEELPELYAPPPESDRNSTTALKGDLPFRIYMATL